MARRILDAPNRVPEILKPEGRVLLRWPAGVLERFPSGTNVVGTPPAALRWILVEPADYGLQVSSNLEGEGTRHPRTSFELRFKLPRAGLPPSRAPVGTAFLVHGYGVDLETMFPWAIYLAEAGWRCVLVDLRGHGSSGGRHVYFGTVETNDLRELRVALERERRVQKPYVAVGHSLGASIVLRWATADREISRCVALGSFSEFRPAMERLRKEYAPWVPAFLVRGAGAKLPELLGVTAEGLDTAAALRGHAVRAYLVASPGDRITPPEDSQALREWLAPGSEFLIVGPATHETLPYLLDQHGPPVRRWLGDLAPRVERRP